MQQPTAAVLRSMEAATSSHPLDRKLLVCSSTGEGRELLRALSTRGVSWLGWEVTTPRRLALDLADAELADEGLSLADAFDEEAAVDTALDRALDACGDRGLRELGESPGFRNAVANTVRALRLAEIPTGRVRSLADAPLPRLLADVLEMYDAALESERLEDVAAVMRRATRALDHGRLGPLQRSRVHLLPGLHLRGVAGALIRALGDAGARILAVDPVGVPVPEGVLWRAAESRAPLGGILGGPPASGGSPGAEHEGRVDLRIFAASGPADELREVLRRVLDEGLRWDEVEIIATDAAVYGAALHALADRLDIPVSYAVGLPVERTRTGRIVAAYFRWLQGGCPADVMRRLLESGDLRPPTGDLSPTRLARRFRRLRIGWGRERYLPALDRATAVLDRGPRPRPGETEEEVERRIAREREELDALRSLLEPIIRTAPALCSEAAARTVSPARVAEGLRTFLELTAVPGGRSPSATALERIRGICDRIVARLTRPTDPAAAIAAVQRHLQIRVPAPRREGSAPWTSQGGHLHLSDIDHGGVTGRPAVFLVGLDAERLGGVGLQDPLLGDAHRRALDPAALPGSADVAALGRFRLAATLARLHGRVTMSYSAWDPAAARAVAPSPVLLQAFRHATGDPSASFADLLDSLGDATSPIPRGAPLDAADVWLAALERDGLLLDGERAVRSAYPRLGRGLEGRLALQADEPNPFHGVLRPRPERLDPRRNADMVLSASRLQDLGTCGRRYLYRYVLGVRKPDDPVLDPDRWLEPMDRGRLLHTVYERTLREAREAGVSAEAPAFEALALRALEAEARTMRLEVPSPGEAIFEREMAGLREDVRSFIEMNLGVEDRWEALELKFGLDGRPPAVLQVKGGEIRLRGAIDRVDREGHDLVVVDYKTGGAVRYERTEGTFHGGRRLQNVLYAMVAESLLGRPVTRMEYQFPTRRGQNQTIAYASGDLARGRGLVARLLELAAGGRFLPTENSDDCRFCDYQAICRHRFDGWSRDTPLADWAAERLPHEPAYADLRDVRGWEEMFLAELENDG